MTRPPQSFPRRGCRKRPSWVVVLVCLVSGVDASPHSLLLGKVVEALGHRQAHNRGQLLKTVASYRLGREGPMCLKSRCIQFLLLC